MNGKCDGTQGYGTPCPHPASFCFSNEIDNAMGNGRIVETCGHHLVSELARYAIPHPRATRFTVVPYNPNVEKLTGAGPMHADGCDHAGQGECPSCL